MPLAKWVILRCLLRRRRRTPACCSPLRAMGCRGCGRARARTSRSRCASSSAHRCSSTRAARAVARATRLAPSAE
eukprot:6181365-Pleurochrysis_carterae.AAC.1